MCLDEARDPREVETGAEAARERITDTDSVARPDRACVLVVVANSERQKPQERDLEPKVVLWRPPVPAAVAQALRGEEDLDPWPEGRHALRGELGCHAQLQAPPEEDSF